MLVFLVHLFGLCLIISVLMLAAVVAGIVAFEELFLRLVARPALARAQRRDWPLDERSALVASQAALAS